MTPKYASLHAGLLARKGEAIPAPVSPISTPTQLRPEGSETPAPVVQQTPPPVPARKSCSPPKSSSAIQDLRPGRVQARHKTTLRLNDEQKRRLRLAAVQLNRSQQSLVSEAIDEFLELICDRDLPHCVCLKKR